MSPSDEELRLRAAMQALREADAKRTPDFRAMVDAPAPALPPRVVRFGRVAPAIGSLAVAAAVIGLFVRSERSANAPATVALAPPAAAVAPPSPPQDAIDAASAPRSRSRSRVRDEVAPLDFLLDAPARAFAAVGTGPATTDFLMKESVR